MTDAPTGTALRLEDLQVCAPIAPWPSAPVTVLVLSLRRAQPVLPALSALLWPEERNELEGHGDPRRRLRRLVSRGALRLALSDLDLPPPKVDRYGKPRLPGQIGDFGLSYAEDLVCLALSERNPIGADLERLPERLAPDAPLFALSPAERRCLMALPAGVRARAFTRAWTVKEAVAKCLGLGVHADFTAIDTSEGKIASVRTHGAAEPQRFRVATSYLPTRGATYLLSVATPSEAVFPAR